MKRTDIKKFLSKITSSVVRTLLVNRAYLLLMLSFTFYNSISAQITFQVTVGGSGDEQVNSIHQTTDGGYIAVGTTNSFGAGANDVYLIKTDSTGSLMWTKTYGGSGDDEGQSVQQTTDGGYIIAGFSNSFSAGGDDDFYVIKTNSTGDTLWTRTYGETTEDQAFSIIQTNNGDYVITGTYHDLSGMATNQFTYTIRIDASGGLLWSRTFNVGSTDHSYSVKQTKDGGFITAGSAMNNNGGTFSSDIILTKTNTNGDTLWTRSIGGIKQEEAYSICQTTDAGYIISGYTHGFGGPSNLFSLYLVKTDSMGIPVWAKTFGETGNNNDRGQSVQQTKDKGYIISGFTNAIGFTAGNTDVYLIKTDSSGLLIWSKTFGGTGFENGYAVQQTTDGGYIIGGYTSSFGAGGNDFYLIKTDADGVSGCNSINPATAENDASSTTFYQNTTYVSNGAYTGNASSAIGTGGSTASLCTTITDIKKESLGNSLNIFPNPTNSNLDIQFTCALKGNITVNLMDMQGRLIYTETKNQLAGFFQTKMDLSNMAKEVYFIQIITDTETLNKKVIVN